MWQFPPYFVSLTRALDANPLGDNNWVSIFSFAQWKKFSWIVFHFLSVLCMLSHVILLIQTKSHVTTSSHLLNLLSPCSSEESCRNPFWLLFSGRLQWNIFSVTWMSYADICTRDYENKGARESWQQTLKTPFSWILKENTDCPEREKVLILLRNLKNVCIHKRIFIECLS